MAVESRQHILDECVVNRNIFWPNMYDGDVMDGRGVFSFKYDEGKRVESVVWRKYKPDLQSVHELGCAKQHEDNRRRPGKEPRKYKGTIDCQVERIRSLICDAGHNVDVIHEPSEGKHHAHLQIFLDGKSDLPSIEKNDLNDLRDELMKAFSELREHACPEG